MAASLDLKKTNVSLPLRPTVQMTVVKSNSLGHVLHEPVKCAVLRQPDKSGLQSSTSVSSDHKKETLYADKFLPKISRIDRGMNEERFVVTRNNGSLAAPPVGTVSPMPNVRAGQQTHEEIPNGKLGLSAGFQVGNAAKLFDSHNNTLLVSETMSVIKSDSVTTTGLVARDENFCRLENEVSILKDQLEIQLKVNADLKKLLVASIGDDLHHKVDALVRTKIQLANEIDDYAKKLVEDYEDLDKMSIQSDIWHSKFKASRVLVDQLTADKNRVSGMFCKAQTALQSLLSERLELQRHLLHSQRCLESVHYAMNSSSLDVNTKHPMKGLHTVDIARYVHHLASEIRSGTAAAELLPTSPRASLDHLSPAEELASEVLAEGSHVTISGFNNPAFGRVLSFPLLQHLHPHARFNDVTFNCCCHCKGQVRVV